MSDWKITITAGVYDEIPGTGLGLVMSHTSGEIPHGTFTIEGSDDGNRIRLAVHQHDPEGRFVTSAVHVRDRAAAALHDAEADVALARAAGAEAGLDVEAEIAVGESIAVDGE